MSAFSPARKNRLSPVATALLALSAAPAWSQTAAPAGVPAADATSTAPQAVTVHGEAPSDFSAGTTSLAKVAADLHDAPQSITVLSKALLQSQGVASLADALRNVPGITLGGAEGGQIGNNINLNGFTARTDIYLDGFRDRGQYYRDTFALDSVEVLMGPSSMLFGRGSTGGVINQVSKTPQRAGLTDVTASVSTTGMKRTTLDHDQAVGETGALRIAAMAQDGAPTTRTDMKYRDYGLAPSLELGIGTADEITLSALLQRNHDMPDYGVPPVAGKPADVGRDAFYGDKDDRTIQDVATFTAAYQHRFSPATVLRNQIQSNRVQVDARETAAQSVSTLVGGAYPTTATLSGAGPYYVRLQSHDRVITDHSVFDQADFTTQLDTGGVHHELLVGAEIGHDTYANQSYSRTGSCNGTALATGYVACERLDAPQDGDSPVTTEVAGNLARSSADSYGLYVGDTASLGPHVKLVGGVRRDIFDARLSNTVTNPHSVAQDVAYTSVRAGTIWQPTTGQSYYVSYSTSFDPSLEQLTNTTGTTAPLPPEINKACEAGGKVDLLAGKLSVNGAVFQITQLNSRSSDSAGNYTATGTIRVRGARLGSSGQIARGWKIFAGYEYMDATILDAVAVGTAGKVPLNTPRNSATLWTTDEFLPHWELGGGAVWQDARYANNTDTTEVPGYVRTDATLAYRQRAYEVRLNVFNLADRHYYDAIIASDGGRAVPGTGRSALLSVSFHL